MTLQELIARHESSQPTAIGTALTPLGHAHVALGRLTRALAALDPQDRAEMLVELAGEIRPLIAELATA